MFQNFVDVVRKMIEIWSNDNSSSNCLFAASFISKAFLVFLLSNIKSGQGKAIELLHKKGVTKN